MKVTALKPAIRTAGRWNIFVDGAYSFSLDESQVITHRLKVGLEIDEQKLSQLKDDSSFGKAYARALDLILRRMRSYKEIEEYARRKEWSDSIRQRVIARLEQRGYLDDQKFAESWVRNREAIKPSSRRKLTLELRQKGIDSGIIQAVLAEEGDHDELATIRRIVAKKQARYQDEQKFMAYLARQGFSFDLIKQVLSGEEN
jgi:regulatory protein